MSRLFNQIFNSLQSFVAGHSLRRGVWEPAGALVANFRISKRGLSELVPGRNIFAYLAACRRLGKGVEPHVKSEGV